MPNTLPSTDERNEMRRLRTEYNFRAKHGDEGLAELMEFAEKCEQVRVVAERFGVSASRVSQIYEVLLGMPYHEWLTRHGIQRKRVPPAEGVE